MSDDDKVEVEAERGRGGKGVVLTLVSVPERRRLMKTYGVHNAYVNDLKRLGTFPPQYITDFYKGSPIRFRMKIRGYESLLEAPRAEALGGTPTEHREVFAAAIKEAEAAIRDAENTQHTAQRRKAAIREAASSLVTAECELKWLPRKEHAAASKRVGVLSDLLDDLKN